MRTYLKCVWVNKFAFVGCVMTPLSIWIGEFSNISLLMELMFACVFSFSIICLVSTLGGYYTYRTYCRAYEIFNRGFLVPENFKRHYCNRVAVELAEREYKKARLD